MSTVRTFIAVECSGGVSSRAAALIERFRSAQAKVSWVKPEQMHWTLKFLGDVELTRTAEICQAVLQAVTPLASFEMEVQGVGAFPSTAKPRTLWVGAGAGSEKMVALSEAIDERLAQVGFPVEGRRFTPHLTIGRVRGQQNMAELGRQVAAQSDTPIGTQWVEEVTVFSSTLERDGPVYDVLGRAELAD